MFNLTNGVKHKYKIYRNDYCTTNFKYLNHNIFIVSLFVNRSPSTRMRKRLKPSRNKIAQELEWVAHCDS